jgi:hypothetical protein
MKLECVPAQHDYDEALKLFKSRMRRLKLGQFMFGTGFFLPYYLFEVEVVNGGKLTSQFLAIDAMTGELDLYNFEQPPAEFDEVETEQIGETTLSEKQALALLKEKVRRMLYLQGFFQIRDLTITGKLVRRLYLPYWVGFFKQKTQADIEVIDAVRGRFEGAKVHDLVYDWFAREAQARRKKT